MSELDLMDIDLENAEEMIIKKKDRHRSRSPKREKDRHRSRSHKRDKDRKHKRSRSRKRRSRSSRK